MLIDEYHCIGRGKGTPCMCSIGYSPLFEFYKIIVIFWHPIQAIGWHSPEVHISPCILYK